MIRYPRLLTVSVMLSLAWGATAADAQTRAENFRVLMITQPPNSPGMHPSSNTASEVMPAIAAEHGFGVDVTTDPAAFTADNLKQYKVVVFVNRNGNSIADPAARAAFESYIRAGGGFVGVHAASTGGAGPAAWPFFTGLLGATFFGHTQANRWGPPFESDPPSPRGVQRIWRGPLEHAPADAEPGTVAGFRQINWPSAFLVIEEPQSPAVAPLLPNHFRQEEWYGVEPNPRPHVRVLATVDDGSYNPAGGAMGADHPIVWCHAYEGGRAVYSSLGHRMATWREDRAFRAHVAGMIAMAAGAAPFDCSPK